MNISFKIDIYIYLYYMPQLEIHIRYDLGVTCKMHAEATPRFGSIHG